MEWAVSGSRIPGNKMLVWQQFNTFLCFKMFFFNLSSRVLRYAFCCCRVIFGDRLGVVDKLNLHEVSPDELVWRILSSVRRPVLEEVFLCILSDPTSQQQDSSDKYRDDDDGKDVVDVLFHGIELMNALEGFIEFGLNTLDGRWCIQDSHDLMVTNLSVVSGVFRSWDFCLVHAKQVTHGSLGIS